MKTIWHEAQVVAIDQISDTKLVCTMRQSDDQPFQWEAGQFITMDLPLGDKRRHRWRSYSIANAYDGRGEIELGIGYLENGSASAYFFNDVQIGSTIRFKGPEGQFVLPSSTDRSIVMIATGTGVVPFRAMLSKIQHQDLDYEHIHLIYGARYERDLLYRDELTRMSDNMPNFHLDIVLSREEEWIGYRGHVHDVYLERYKEKSEEYYFMLCGWSSMIDEAMPHLMRLVVNPPGQIKYELYG